MKNVIMLCVFILISLNSYARESGRVGNGGGAIFCKDGRTVVLDFYEAQINDLYTFNNLNNLEINEILDLLYQRVDLYDSTFSKLLKKLTVFFNQKKVFVQNASFKIPDDFRNIFYEQSCEIKVVAVQRRPYVSVENVFFIDQSLWNQLDNVSKAGLIMHEILYIVSLNLESTNSKEVREALAYIMSDQFVYNELEMRKKFFNKVTNGGFFSRLKPFFPILCPRLNRYDFVCPNI